MNSDHLQIKLAAEELEGDAQMTETPNRIDYSEARSLAARKWILPLAAAALLYGCGKPPEATPAKPAGGAEPASAAIVNVAPAQIRTINKSIDVNGSLIALQDVVVGSKGSGRLASVSVHEGDTVSSGQIVAVLDTTDLNAQVQQAQANVRASVTREQQARVALAQARNQLQNARTQLRWTEQTTNNAIRQAKSGVELAQQRLAVIREGARPQERAQAEEQIRSARANYEKARADLKRYQALYRENAIAAVQLDEKQAAFDAAQAQLNGATQAASLVMEGAREEEKRQAEIAVQQARDTLARAEVDRATVQLRREDVQNAQVAIKSAEAGIKTAEATTEQTRAGLRIAQDALSNAYIKSPINGIVAERRAEPGSQLMQGGAVLRIVNPRSVYFQAVLSESQFAEVREGQTATVRVDAVPGKTFGGRVRRILPVASTAARSFNVRINITPSPQLRSQMFARGSILIATRRGATVIRKEAVLYDPVTKTARVFVSKPSGEAEERKVVTGYTDNGHIEIVTGVRAGEQVVVTGQTSLQNGDKVRVEGADAGAQVTSARVAL